jgi:DHA2 family multidrug resistance protein
VVALAAFMEIMDISIANVALPHIAGALSSSQNESTWVLTSYLVTNAVVMPLSGWLSNTFGRKRLFLTCIGGFTLPSLLCGFAPNLPMLIVLRALQGPPVAGCSRSARRSSPTASRGAARHGLRDLRHRGRGRPQRWARRSAAGSPTTTIGAGSSSSTCRSASRLIFLVIPLIQDRGPQRTGSFSVDRLGFGFVALSLGCLQVVLDRGQDADWFGSPLITVLAIVSAAAFVLLIWRELTHEHPMVDLRLMKNPDFAVNFCLMLMLGFMLFGSTFLLPAYAQQLMGYRAVDAGMLLTPGGFATIALLPLVGRAINKVDLRLLTAIGLVVGGASLLLMTNVYLDVSFGTLMWLRILQSAALPFLFVPINAMAFRGIPPEKTNNASALINLARNFGGSIGISFAATLLTRRAQFHQSRIVEQLQPLNPSYPDYAHHVGSLLGRAADAPATLAGVYAQAVQQATLLSYLDDFKALGLLFLALLPLLLLVRKGKGGGPVAVH